jgi:hypothetical protein
METRSTILNELKELSPAVSQIGPDTPYQVPKGYFDSLAAMIMARIKTENASAKDELQTLSPLLSGLSKKMPFQAPEGYFSQLSGNLVGSLQPDDVSPLLDSLRTRHAYSVPQGYFETLPAAILSKVQEKRPARVVSMTFGRKVLRYAAAAIITGVMAIGGWMYFGKDTSTSATQEQAGAIAIIENMFNDQKVSEDDISNFLENETFPAATAMNVQVSEEPMDEKDIREMLSDVSEEELNQFIITL